MFYSLAGLWTAELESGARHSAILPGTLDENKIGVDDHAEGSWHPDEEFGEKSKKDRGAITTRLSRKYTYEGAVKFRKRITWLPPKGKRVFLEAERARHLGLFIDGEEVGHDTEPSLSTPHIFEVTDQLNGNNEILLISDNSYPGLPYDAITYSSAVTDETQTNWNGILGYFRLRTEEQTFLSAVRVYPKNDAAFIQILIDSARPCKGRLTIKCDALLEKSVTKAISIPAGKHEMQISSLPLKKDVRRWDEYEGNLYELTAELLAENAKKAENVKNEKGEKNAGNEINEKKTVCFGIRDFGDNGSGRFAINGRTIFLRGEANCAVFPETGYPPMEVEKWIAILERFRSYGVNCMRFHSHCPPEAAFTAADQLGMLMQPELSHWNPKDALDSAESFGYYQTELRQIIRTLANHPSFVMLTFGNELWPTTASGQKHMEELLDMAHESDPTRLYANGSNVFYGERGCDEKSDFYTSQGYYQGKIRGSSAGMPEKTDEENQKRNQKKKYAVRGYINQRYPSAAADYDEVMDELRKAYQKPVFSFEVGQYEVLPDFDELEEFHGITRPDNLISVQKRVEERGLKGVWKQYVEATGELARLSYREEIEAAMRTGQLSGVSLLGLQDFPGQGTALVGMMDSHLRPKPFPFSEPDAFRSFFRQQLPLVYLPKYTYENTEVLKAEVRIANYGKEAIKGVLKYELNGRGMRMQGELPEAYCPAGELRSVGNIELSLREAEEALKLELKVSIGDVWNAYPVWVYPPVHPKCPAAVYETERFDRKAEEVLEAGGTVYLSPESVQEALPNSIQAQFTTDFWSTGTFPQQEGGMGQLIDAGHPIFEYFPTETHTNWQWWPMAVQRAVILPKPIKAVIIEMDSYASLRHMAQLFECRCKKGKVLFSSMGLQNLQQYPEARALLDAVYHYMNSGKFQPEQICDPGLFQELVH